MLSTARWTTLRPIIAAALLAIVVPFGTLLAQCPDPPSRNTGTGVQLGLPYVNASGQVCTDISNTSGAAQNFFICYMRAPVGKLLGGPTGFPNLLETQNLSGTSATSIPPGTTTICATPSASGNFCNGFQLKDANGNVCAHYAYSALTIPQTPALRVRIRIDIGANPPTPGATDIDIQVDTTNAPPGTSVDIDVTTPVPQSGTSSGIDVDITSPGGQGRVRIRMRFSGASDDFDVIDIDIGAMGVGSATGCSPQVTAPTTESFESGATGFPGTYPAGWTDGGGASQWNVWSGGTSSLNTGPMAAANGMNYMYCETSGGAQGPWILEGPCTDVSALSRVKVGFCYHMNFGGAGSQATHGVLKLEVSDGGGGWIHAGQVQSHQGIGWGKATIDVTPFVVQGTLKYRFVYDRPLTGLTQASFVYDCAIDQVVVAPCEYELNDPASSLDFDGVQGSEVSPAVTIVPVGTTSNANLNGNAGLGHEIGITLSPAVPASAGGVTTGGGQVVNLNLADPTLLFLYNLTFPPLAPGPIPVTPTTSIGITGQMMVIAPTNPDGFSLSQAARLQTATPTSPGGLALGDDTNVELFLGATVAFYGTQYGSLFVNSNGDVSFTTGHTDFTATIAEWESQMPRIGLHSDLSPNNGGTVSFTDAGGLLSIDYVGVPQFPAGPQTATHSIQFDRNNGSAAIANVAWDPTWSQATVGGISNGAAGTHPGAGLASISFDANLGNTLFGAPSDSHIDANPAGGLPNTSGWTSVVFGNSDGSVVTIN